MEKTIEKAEELKSLDIVFADEVTLADAIRMGSQNSEQAYGWGDGETQCALHAAVSAGIAQGFIEV